MRATLAAAPLAPPGRAQLAADGAGQAVLEFLASSGEVVQLDQDIVLPADAYEQARAAVVAYLRRNQAAPPPARYARQWAPIAGSSSRCSNGSTATA